jgi:putative spermidine/putrescine transport system permease protein
VAIASESSGDKIRQLLARAGLVSPSMALVLFVTLMPLALMLRYSFNVYDPAELMKSAFVWDNYARFFGDKFFQGVLLTTLIVSGACALICTIFALPLAYVLARESRAARKSLLLVLIFVPLLVGNAARSVGWSVILADTGLFNGMLMSAGIIGEPIRVLYTYAAVIISLVSLLLPYTIISIQSVLEGIPVSLEEAAMSLGAGPLTVVRKVILPLAMPGIYTGAIICFILTMSAYAAPVLLGGSKFQMMAPIVYQQITRVSNWPFGAALAFILMSSTLILTILSNAYLQRRYGRL